MVASYTQLLAKRYRGQLDQDADLFIDFAVDGCNRMKILIQDLLAFSRVGTHHKELEVVAMDDIVDQAMLNLQEAVSQSGAVVTRGALPVIHSSKTLLTQVIQNLVGNAIKYRNSHSPEVKHLRISRYTRRDQSFRSGITGLALSLNTSIESSFSSKGCMVAKNFPGPELVWQSARRSSTDLAAGSGLNRNCTTALLSASLFHPQP